MKETYIYKPVQFFLFVNLFMWITWLPVAISSYQPAGSTSGLLSILILIGLCGPFIGSLWFIFTSKSEELKRNYFKRLFNLRLIKPITLLPILLTVPIAASLAVWLSHLFFGLPMSQLTIAKETFKAGIFSGALLLFLAPLLEELGWKGYGVDSLRGKNNFLTVSLIYGGLWALWHLPCFFINGYYQNMIFLENPLFALNFLISVLPTAIIINWLWYKNQGSILTAVLFHFVFDLQGFLQMGQIAKCIETGVFIIMAIIVVYFNRNVFLKQFPPQIGNYGEEGIK